MNEIDDAVMHLKEVMARHGIDPRDGLPESVFQLTTALVPIVNIDLFTVDEFGRLLLTWREDYYNTCGWHIPGGCVRLQETLSDRIQKTAISEIGTEVEFRKQPIAIRGAVTNKKNGDLYNQLERSHGISFLYLARLPQGITISNESELETTPGYKKWFHALPEKILPIHMQLYGDILRDWFSLSAKIKGTEGEL